MVSIRFFATGALRSLGALAASAALLLGSAVFLAPRAYAAPAPAQLGATLSVGELRVVVDSAVPGGASRGFGSASLRVTNDSSKQERLAVELVGAPTFDVSQATQKWTLRLAPGESTSFEMLANLDRSGGRGSYSVRLESGGDRQYVSLGISDESYYPGARVIGFLGESELPELALAGRKSDLPLDPAAMTVLGAFSESVSGRGGHPAEQVAQLFSLAFEDLPRRAVAWSHVDTVIVDVDRDLSSDARWERLFEWVHQGGQLAFVGDDLDRRLRQLEGIEALTDERFRLGASDAHSPIPPELGSSIRLYRVGFGTLALQARRQDEPLYFSGPAKVPGPAPPVTTRSITVSAPGSSPEFAAGSDGSPVVRTLQALDAVRIDRSPWPSTMASLYAGSSSDQPSPWETDFPEDGLPIRTVLGMLTIFVMLVGPFSVVYARKKEKPGLLLVAVPLISFVSTAVIVGYGVLRQGLGTEGYAHSISIVDQVQKHATSALRRELVMGRSGQTLKPLPATAVLVPITRSSGQTRVIEEEGNQLTLSGDFLPVRTRTAHVTLSSGQARARLEWAAPSGDSMTVTNALGVKLEALEVMSLDGRVFAATGVIDQGASATLKEQPSSNVAGFFDKAKNEPMFSAAQLRPGGYLAVAAEAGPGVDDATVEMKELLHLHGIVGYLDTDPTKWTR